MAVTKAQSIPDGENGMTLTLGIFENIAAIAEPTPFCT
jgi:hypothetical protein